MHAKQGFIFTDQLENIDRNFIREKKDDLCYRTTICLLTMAIISGRILPALLSSGAKEAYYPTASIRACSSSHKHQCRVIPKPSLRMGLASQPEKDAQDPVETMKKSVEKPPGKLVRTISAEYLSPLYRPEMASQH